MGDVSGYYVRDMVFVRTVEGRIFNLSNKKCQILAVLDEDYRKVLVDGREFRLHKQDILSQSKLEAALKQIRKR